MSTGRDWDLAAAGGDRHEGLGLPPATPPPLADEILPAWTPRVPGIRPPGCDAWPENGRQALYWSARCSFVWHGEALCWRIAASRHYRVYLNGKLAVHQLNFANSPDYLIGQTWQDELNACLRAGENQVLVEVRSDPFGSKHHQPFLPALWLEAASADRLLLATGPDWETSVQEGPRRRLALATTHYWERIALAPAAPPAWRPAGPAAEQPRRFLLWNDRPCACQPCCPRAIVASGGAELPACLYRHQAPERELVAQFQAAAGERVAIASSALLPHSISLNGEPIGAQCDSPGRGQMPLYNYARPTALGAARAGANELRIRFATPGEFVLCSSHSLVWQTDAVTTVEATWGTRVNALASRPCPTAATAPVDGGLRLAAGTHALLDLGELRYGCLHVAIRAEGAGSLVVGYGTMRQGDTVDCQRMGREAVEILDVAAGEQHYAAWEPRCARYLQVIALGTDLELRQLHLLEERFVGRPDTPPLTCSDPGLEAVLRASLRTAELCTGRLYMDNPDREQAQWIDNARPAMTAGYYWFGEQRRAAKALLEMQLSQAPDGQYPGYAPGRWFPRIPLQGHMALYVLACCDYLDYSGDRATARELLPGLLRAIAHWERHRPHGGLIEDLHTLFIDWGSHIYSYVYSWRREPMPRTGAITTINAYYLGVLRAVARFAENLGETATASQLRTRADDFANLLRDKLYVPEWGLFRDGRGLPAAEGAISQTANALAVWAGAAPAGQAGAILQRAFGPERPPAIIMANAHFAQQTLSALFAAGCAELALDWVRRTFGPMLAAGSSTLWETVEPHASHCQGTGAAVAAAVARYVGGLYPARPGFATIGFAPQASGLERFDARLSLPDGPAQICWECPEGALRVRLVLPRAWRGRPLDTTVSELEIDYR